MNISAQLILFDAVCGALRWLTYNAVLFSATLALTLSTLHIALYWVFALSMDVARYFGLLHNETRLDSGYKWSWVALTVMYALLTLAVAISFSVYGLECSNVSTNAWKITFAVSVVSFCYIEFIKTLILWCVLDVQAHDHLGHLGQVHNAPFPNPNPHPLIQVAAASSASAA